VLQDQAGDGGSMMMNRLQPPLNLGFFGPGEDSEEEEEEEEEEVQEEKGLF
jgi:hypothetical protein